MMDAIKKITETGISFLGSEQKKDGSFKDFAWTTTKETERNTTFSTSLILDILSTLELNVETINKKAVKFLINQKSENSTYNYWKRESKEAMAMPYPDDLDDTSCALAALLKAEKDSITGEDLAKFINILTFLESKVGGPYKTWLVPEESSDSWKDIDIVVNSNIGYFLSLNEVNLPNIDKLIEVAIDKNKICSPYYISEMAVPYFISRFYKGTKKEKLIAIILEKLRVAKNPMDSALGISTLLNLGYPFTKIEKNIKGLIADFKKGRWKKYPFVLESNHKGKKYISGSSALTYAFCLEALNMYQAKQSDKAIAFKSKGEGELLFAEGLTMLKNRYKKADKKLSIFAEPLLEKVFAGKSAVTAVLIPYYFSKSLKNIKVDDDLVFKLCYIHLCGWFAYSLYDNFLDNEQDPKTLALANIAFRELISCAEEVKKLDSGLENVFSEILDKIEAANFWEVSNARGEVKNDKIFIPKEMPDYKKNVNKISDKSLGIALGPLAILVTNGFGRDSKEFKSFLTFITKYIKSRQLCDDLHDLEDDLKKGIFTKVVTDVVLKWQAGSGKNEIILKNDLRGIQEIFWYSLVDNFCAEISRDIKIAGRAIKEINLIDSEFFLKLLAGVETTVKTTLEERNRAVEFIKAYK